MRPPQPKSAHLKDIRTHICGPDKKAPVLTHITFSNVAPALKPKRTSQKTKDRHCGLWCCPVLAYRSRFKRPCGPTTRLRWRGCGPRGHLLLRGKLDVWHLVVCCSVWHSWQHGLEMARSTTYMWHPFQELRRQSSW